MDYKNISNDMLYEIVKRNVPDIPINKVNDSNRNMVIAVLRVIERVTQRKEAR